MEQIEQNKFEQDADFLLEEMVHHPNGQMVAYGVILNDTKGRFEDGRKVRTSYVVDIYHNKENMFFRTRNTVYRVTGFA